ncbi:hypothetical protein L596_002957 [Steinernema carpocapsae]|uniref:Uncharacterized protein n=1 Tax=Steinernema carpocapsae TaxID=34508 RepID=A0A4U8UTU7_STECR|nr:hypothetical protein L596_002957 [Steinernema carpocapsae]
MEGRAIVSDNWVRSAPYENSDVLSDAVGSLVVRMEFPGNSTFLLLLTVLIAIPNLLYYVLSSQISKETFYREELKSDAACNKFALQWIVITSIAHRPTKAIRRLSQEKDWNIVVVGDKKGPLEPISPEWSELGNVCVLTVENQKRLKFNILRKLKYGSYTRKMIGYLYAIKFGAQWIYDTDDDNFPINLGISQFDKTGVYQGMSYVNVAKKGGFNMSNHLFNPYEFFGQRTIWPRGYPLSHIRISNDVHRHKLCLSLPLPLIQQGLVDKDPDVDAIYRLINADPKSGLNMSFSSVAPPVLLGNGIYAPFNSQNTLFHRDAFFGLFLPVSVAFRVTDIWRGYFAQKLLHLSGNFVGFYPVNARQERNVHSYLDDFKEEKALYDDAERVVQLIARWKCSEDTLDGCAMELSRLFAAKSFWGNEENGVLKAWLDDLTSLNYKFPKIVNGTTVFNQTNCRRSYLNFMVESSEERQIRKGRNMAQFVQWCDEVAANELADNFTFPLKEQISTNGRENRALIITSNYQFIASVGILDRLYDGYFAHVIFCGPFYPQFVHPQYSDKFPSARKVSFIHLYEQEMHEGFFAYFCTTKAIEMRLQNIEGFIVVADDAIYNFWNHISLDRFRLNGVTRRKGTWWKGPYGATAINSTINDLRNRLQSNDSVLKQAWKSYEEGVRMDGFELLSERDVWGVSDWYYVPSSNFSTFHAISQVLFDNNVFHEIAVPKLGAGLGWLEFYKTENLDVPNSLHVWFKRSSWPSMYHEKLIYFHPVKMSAFGQTLPRRLDFCKSVVTAFAKNLFGFALTYEDNLSEKAVESMRNESNGTSKEDPSGSNPVRECCNTTASLSPKCLHLCDVKAISSKKRLCMRNRSFYVLRVFLAQTAESTDAGQDENDDQGGDKGYQKDLLDLRPLVVVQDVPVGKTGGRRPEEIHPRVLGTDSDNLISCGFIVQNGPKRRIAKTFTSY